MKIISPKNLVHLLELLDSTQPKFTLFAGGTDIFPSLHSHPANYDILFDLAPLESELHFIKTTSTTITIGALTTLTEIVNNSVIRDKVPQLHNAVNSIGSLQIRNQATLVGNLANASPLSDSAPVLLSKNALLQTQSRHTKRELPLSEFFLDYKETALQKNEIITSVSFCFNDPLGQYGFTKVALRPDMGISKLNFAYALEHSSVNFAAGGVAKFPTRLPTLESHFAANLTKPSILDLLQQDISPITDIRSTRQYRLEVLANLIYSLSKKLSQTNSGVTGNL